ncbi:hypothetical protein OPQ81_011115 [Rhizoctonia solani]|nr:hypothetical protein OPQ81_011115 [Rhizoctonia solani]
MNLPSISLRNAGIEQCVNHSYHFHAEGNYENTAHYDHHRPDSLMGEWKASIGGAVFRGLILLDGRFPNHQTAFLSTQAAFPTPASALGSRKHIAPLPSWIAGLSFRRVSLSKLWIRPSTSVKPKAAKYSLKSKTRDNSTPMSTYWYQTTLC